ncbi:unnamed protein product [Bursaphelenchus xylophilus]|uniref:(pine wood nematode) hypothetical protein n=1 Tax=Bursaphelenchus xylophilus TaxID=6326 RepID=A0A1I7RT18_BURXY|nr:unnamed protein product [Bursaphelenchus xylophilus]CAG9122674.1 unnamed protein product [Bursaphelenchus xylophilus]
MPCTNCMVKYSLIKREHGCPNCGFGFCARCINKKAVVKRISDKPLAVCDKCFEKIKGNLETKEEVVDFKERPPASFKDVYDQKGQKKSVEKATNSKVEDQDLIERLAKLKNKSVDEIQNPMKMVIDPEEKDNNPLIGREKTKKETPEDLLQKALDDPSVKNKEFDKQQHEYEVTKLEERLANLRNVPVEEIRKPRTIVFNDIDLSESETELTDDAKELIAMAEKSLRKKEPDLFAYENEALDSDIEDPTDFKK